MAARIRPPVPYGANALPTVGARLLAWLRSHPFDVERVKEQAWRGRVAYAQAMGRR